MFVPLISRNNFTNQELSLVDQNYPVLNQYLRHGYRPAPTNPLVQNEQPTGDDMPPPNPDEEEMNLMNDNEVIIDQDQFFFFEGE
jgi:hypothetical protein